MLIAFNVKVRNLYSKIPTKEFVFEDSRTHDVLELKFQTNKTPVVTEVNRLHVSHVPIVLVVGSNQPRKNNQNLSPTETVGTG